MSIRSLSPQRRFMLLAALAGAVAAGLALAPKAQSQIRANPSYQPVGVSANGNASTAWFHDPSTGRAIACTASAGSIQCQSARLPQE